MATLPMFFSITKHFPDSLCLQGRWAKQVSRANSITSTESWVKMLPMIRRDGLSVADTSPQTWSIRCDRLWKSSSWLPEAAAQSGSTQTWTQSVYKAYKAGHKALFSFTPCTQQPALLLLSLRLCCKPPSSFCYQFDGILRTREI